LLKKSDEIFESIVHVQNCFCYRRTYRENAAVITYRMFAVILHKFILSISVNTLVPDMLRCIWFVAIACNADVMTSRSLSPVIVLLMLLLLSCAAVIIKLKTIHAVYSASLGVTTCVLPESVGGQRVPTVVTVNSEVLSAAEI